MSIVLILAAFSPVVTVKAATSEVKSFENSLQQAIKSKNWTNAAIYSKKLAVYYDERKQYDKAIPYYNNSAIYWDKAGHPSWGIQNTIRANHISTELQLYVEEPLPLNQQLGKFEPTGGTYLGLYMAGKREKSNPELVDDIYGKNHAIYLTYTHWRQKYADTDSYFPLSFAAKAKKVGSAIQIGWEPSNGLNDVKDDEYVRQFAREAKQSGVPVFLRFASEMNGEWVPWSGDPKKYIEKFRLVSKIMKEEAPNVIMVWSPNFLPRDNIDPYYPGDAWVDWVGLSLYTIPYSHGEEVLGGNPIDYLKPIYEKYCHKPFIISEGAVSHYSYELKKDYSTWAAGEIGNMYGFMPRMFPKVKAITYFNLNKQTTNYDNQNNNYDLADSKIVDDAYKRMISNNYFLSTLTVDSKNDTIQTQYLPVTKIKEVAGKHNAFVYVKLPLGVQPYYVAVYQGKKKLGESYAQPWNMTIDFSTVDPKQPITLIAFDKNFKRLATKNVTGNFKKVNTLSRFTDVSGSHWAINAINNAVDSGIAKGVPGGKFLPDQNTTNTEFMTMLIRYYGKGNEIDKEPYPNGTLQFMKNMNYPYVDAGNKPITRAMAAEMIAATHGLNLTGDDAIKYLLVNGLSKGTNPNRISVEDYKGANPLTRAEAVTFILNLKNGNHAEILVRPNEPTDPASIQKEYMEKFE